ncbi:hypothetical protein L7F22_035101 [Adiantum nelumboides]|nr:hypothetical protein [Adiantum nelumboides]
MEIESKEAMDAIGNGGDVDHLHTLVSVQSGTTERGEDSRRSKDLDETDKECSSSGGSSRHLAFLQKLDNSELAEEECKEYDMASLLQNCHPLASATQLGHDEDELNQVLPQNVQDIMRVLPEAAPNPGDGSSVQKPASLDTNNVGRLKGKYRDFCYKEQSKAV